MANSKRQKEDLAFSTRLGKGFFGEVWKAVEVAGEQRTLAVKKIKLQLITEHRLTDQMRREINILYSLDHPRIIRLFYDFNDNRHMYLAMEFATGGSLFEKLHRARKFSPEVAARYFLETCEAVDYIHHLPEKVIHRDIKPENILLDGEDHVKLADFGWANLVEADLAKRETFCGTLDYLPPEMIMGTGHDESADMWNMGVLLYELTTGQSPFGSPSKEETCRLILQVDLRFPPELDADAKDLVAALCKKKPADRLDVRGAINHKFVTKFIGNGPQNGGKDVEESDARPSVCVRKLQRDYEKVGAEIKIAEKAKENSEASLREISSELDKAKADIRKEREQRTRVEVECAEVKKRINDRAKEIEMLRKQLAHEEAGYPKRGSMKDKFTGLIKAN